MNSKSDNKKIGCDSCAGVNNKFYFRVFILLVIVLSVFIFISSRPAVKQGNAVDQLATEYNVKVDMQNTGNLDAVSQEKIDSLFDNLK